MLYFQIVVCFSKKIRVIFKLPSALKNFIFELSSPFLKLCLIFKLSPFCRLFQAIYRMITTDLSTTKTDLKLIEDLVTTFFKSADRNHDNAISQEEFVDGVKEMPVILHLLQCDPEAAEDIDEVGTVEKFDSLHVSEKQLSSNKGKIGEESNDSATERHNAYKAK